MNEIFRRTSVRKFLETPVEEEKIERLLRAAMAAPSAKNQQPWEFYVVKNREVLLKLSKCSDYAMSAKNAPAAIAVCCRLDILRPEFRYFDASAATENILLEAVSLGLGAVWLSMAPYRDRMDKAAEALGLDPSVEAFAVIPIGYPAKDKQQEDRYDESRITRID